MARTKIAETRTTAEISAGIADDRRRIAALERELAENARAIEAKEAERNDRIADGGSGVEALNREIAELRIEAEGYRGGMATLTRRVAEREAELREADAREKAAEHDAAVARAVEAIETLDEAIRLFISQEFTPLDKELREAGDAARAAESRFVKVTGRMPFGSGRVYDEGWSRYPGLDQIIGALRTYANAAD
jgi:septal ring factor EnvC (AmiA/AmiB activator)